MKRWRGRTALVTGASAGIGRAVALELARNGMRVALLARRRERLAEVEAAIAAKGGEAWAVVADLRDALQIRRAFEEVRARAGGVDALVNAAGLGRVAPLASGDAEAFREMLEVNVLGLAVATREAVADMLARGAAGQIVHVSSMSAYRVQAGNGMYAATKHAVRAMTEGLRLELRAAKSPIRVAAVSPADTDTEFMAAMLGSAKEAAARRPSYRTLDPGDVADAVLQILAAPPHVEIHDILLRPVDQPD